MKKAQFEKSETMINILKTPIPDDNHFDYHYYYMSLYLKLNSQVVSFLLDFAMGIILCFILSNYAQEILELLHYFGQGLHIDVL